MSLEIKFLEIAKSDFKASKVLYDINDYGNALFHLQQGVEKCVKSLGLALGLVDEKGLKNKISHLPHKVFARLLNEKIKTQEKLDNVKVLVPEVIPIHWKNKNRRTIINKLKKTYNQINHLKFEEGETLDIKCLANFIKEAKEKEKQKISKSEVYELVKDDWVKTNTHFKNLQICYTDDLKEKKAIEERYKPSIERPEKFIEQKVHNRLAELRKDLTFDFINFVWLNLSIITSPHEQTSRYPSTGKVDNPKSFYSLENPVINLLPDLVDLMNNSISKFEELEINK